MGSIRIATRRSALARRQGRLVADAIRSANPGIECRLVSLTTAGDRRSGRLADLGGKGLFTADLERRLRSGDVHVAVHSAKDLPAEMPDDLAIAAVPPRADPRDALVSSAGAALGGLAAGARIGTGSLRRRAQVLSARADLHVVPLRGNVERRVAEVLEAGALDAAVLAMAGLVRSGLVARLGGRISAFEVGDFIPAAGQGALAVQILEDNDAVRRLLSPIDHADSHAALLAERSVLRALGTDCRSAVGVHIARRLDGWWGLAMVGSADGARMLRDQAEGETAEAVATRLAEALEANGASAILNC